MAMAWVDEACGGFFDKEQAGTLKATDVYLFRVAAMLDDFAVRGAVLRRYPRTVGKLAAGQADVVSRFQAVAAGCRLRRVDCAVSAAPGMVRGDEVGHLLRDLAAVHTAEPDRQFWAAAMADTLAQANQHAAAARAAGHDHLDEVTVKKIRNLYRGATTAGITTINTTRAGPRRP